MKGRLLRSSPFTADEPELARIDAAFVALDPALERAAATSDTTGMPSAQVIHALRTSELMGAAAPAEYGGLEIWASGLNSIIERVAWSNASAAIMLFQHFAVTSRIVEWGTSTQKQLYLPRLASGEWFAASAWSEEGASANKRRIATTASQLDGGGWTITGRKAFVTTAGYADIYLVLATTSATDDTVSTYGSFGQSFFIVEPIGGQVKCDEYPDLVGMRGSATGFVSFRGATVGEHALLGPEDEATKVIASVRDAGMTLGAVSVGLAQRAHDLVLEHVVADGHQRDEVVIRRLVDAEAKLAAARAIVAQAGRRDAADPGRTTLYSKLFAASFAEDVIFECQRLLGSTAYLRTHVVNRLARDARAVGLMGPTNDLCRDLLGTWRSDQKGTL